jgi:hypothetical protein
MGEKIFRFEGSGGQFSRFLYKFLVCDSISILGRFQIVVFLLGT